MAQRQPQSQKMEKVQVLEPIQEESEQEDETFRTGKENEEEEEEEEKNELAAQVGVKIDEVLAAQEREEDDFPLRVLRPGRRSGSITQESLIQIQFNEHKKQTETSLLFDASAHSTNLCEGAPALPMFGKERLKSGKLKIKVSKSKWKKQTGPDQPKKKSRYKEPFPQWLMNLMVNIEEATSHQLVVEQSLPN